MQNINVDQLSRVRSAFSITLFVPYLIKYRSHFTPIDIRLEFLLFYNAVQGSIALIAQTLRRDSREGSHGNSNREQ